MLCNTENEFGAKIIINFKWPQGVSTIFVCGNGLWANLMLF